MTNSPQRAATLPEEIDAAALLQGRYEKTYLDPDVALGQSVPDYAFNILNRYGLLYRPILDEIGLASGQPKPSWPGDATFAVCLTHDADIVSRTSVRQHARGIANTLQPRPGPGASETARRLLGHAYGIGNSLRRRLRQDPIQCFERWLEIENEVGARSTFFFFPDRVRKRHTTDGCYRYADRVVFDGKKRTISEMIREINHRGWEIGIHPCWRSHDDAEELVYQKEQLEEVLGRPVCSVRHHYLVYHMRKTPRVHEEAGLQYDSTLGFNANTGFRFGTCYPWELYDLERRRRLNVLEVPLIVQDVALLVPQKMGLDLETAFEYIVLLADRVEKVGGVLTLSWHPDRIDDSAYMELYERSLRYLHERQPWFATVRMVGERWQRSSSPGVAGPSRTVREEE